MKVGTNEERTEKDLLTDGRSIENKNKQNIRTSCNSVLCGVDKRRGLRCIGKKKGNEIALGRAYSRTMHDFIRYRLYLRFDGLSLFPSVSSLSLTVSNSQMPYGIPFWFVANISSVFHIHAYPACDLYANDVGGDRVVVQTGTHCN